MKKIFIAIAAIGAAYCAGAYVSGRIAEQTLREQLVQMQQQQPDVIKDARIVEYRRGIFTSDMRVIAKALPRSAELGEWTVTLDSHLHHGPLLFVDHPSLGLFAADMRIRPQTGNTEIDGNISRLFGDSIGVLTTVMSFGDTYRMRWVIPAIESKDGDKRFSMAESVLTGTGNYRDQSGKAHMTTGRIEASSPGRTATIAPIVMDVDSKTLEAGLKLTDIDMAIAQVDIVAPPQPPLHMQQLAFRQKQTLNGANIDTSDKFSVARLDTATTLEKLYLNFDLNGLDRPAMKFMATMFDNQPAQPEQVMPFMQQQYMKLLTLLPKDASLRVELGAHHANGDPQAQLVLQYQPPADGRSVAALTEYVDYLQLANGSLLVKVPAAMVPAPMVSPYIGQYIAQDGNDYVLRANLQQGNLEVGQVTMPKEQLAANLENARKQRAEAAAKQQAAPKPAAVQTGFGPRQPSPRSL